MENENPILVRPEEARPVELYEPPALLDLEEVTAQDPCCDTGGGSCTPPL